MASSTVHVCKCPLCSDPGKSVAAINYAETQRWVKHGSFSGAGVGIGTGGLGVGVGGGTYAEQGELQTKRADIFEEPAQFTKPVFGLVLFGAIGALMYSFIPTMFGALMPATSVQASGNGLNLDQVARALAPVLSVVGPLVGLLFGGVMLMRASNNQQEEDELNAEVLPKQIERYNQLRYCEACHVLFDNQGRSEQGNAIGFGKMMNYPA